MPNPTGSEVHVSQALNNLSIAYVQAQTNFVAMRCFPPVMVSKQFDKYYEFNESDWGRDEAMVRGVGQESAGGGYRLSTSTYNCDVYAYHKDIDDYDRKNADSVLQFDRSATQFVTQKMMIKHERDFQNKAFTTGIWGTDVTPAVTWDNVSSDPISDIATGVETIAATGFRPNKLLLGSKVYTRLRNHPDVTDRFKYTSANSITEAMLAQLFDVAEVIVARAVYVSSVEGAAITRAFALNTTNALLFYAPQEAMIMNPSAGYTFNWNFDEQEQPIAPQMQRNLAVQMRRFRIEEKRATRVEGEAAWDNQVTGAALGYFFNGAVA